jgi:hypothetical protein
MMRVRITTASMDEQGIDSEMEVEASEEDGESACSASDSEEEGGADAADVTMRGQPACSPNKRKLGTDLPVLIHTTLEDDVGLGEEYVLVARKNKAVEADDTSILSRMTSPLSTITQSSGSTVSSSLQISYSGVVRERTGTQMSLSLPGEGDDTSYDARAFRLRRRRAPPLSEKWNENILIRREKQIEEMRERAEAERDETMLAAFLPAPRD